MNESGPPDRLQRLGEEIDQARLRAGEGATKGGGDATTGSALGDGLRIGIEMIAALIVGLGLGWLADHFFGTRPWGLVVGFFLGSAAGIVNVFRAVQGLGRPPGGGQR